MPIEPGIWADKWSGLTIFIGAHRAPNEWQVTYIGGDTVWLTAGTILKFYRPCPKA